MKRKILVEASGSLVCGYLIKAIQDAGHVAVASDVTEDCIGRYLADEFVLMPFSNDPNLWDKTVEILKKNKIEIVIPSFDETLLGWAIRKEEFAKQGIFVVISDLKVIETFTDKWLTFQFFEKHNIPTPKSSLSQDYQLVKPRDGRGGRGVRIDGEKIDMAGMISQQLIDGEEYTIDVFCNQKSNPVYIVPRKRINIRDGKSTQGIVVQNSKLESIVRNICNVVAFVGPINVQCFIDRKDHVQAIEINPRVAGGMALGFAATENWINLIVNNLILGQPIEPRPIKYDLKMLRYYAELFIPEH